MKLVTVMSAQPEEPQALLNIILRFNNTCNHLSEIAYRERLFHWLPLQRRTYHEIRANFSLSAAEAMVAIRKVAYAYRIKERRS